MEDADEPSLVSWKMIQCMQMHQQSFSVLCSIRTGPDDYNSLPEMQPLTAAVTF